jgi:hypothetical protein
MGLDSILDVAKSSKGEKHLNSYLKKASEGVKNFYKTNLSVKFKLLYESAAMFSDRILTFLGIEYRVSSESNPIMARLFNYAGVIPVEVASYMAANVLLYYFTSKIHKKIGLKPREMLGSVYLGLGGAESLVSLHNYLLINNYNDAISNMTYTQSLFPIGLIIAAPFTYYLYKDYRLKKVNREKKAPKI